MKVKARGKARASSKKRLKMTLASFWGKFATSYTTSPLRRHIALDILLTIRYITGMEQDTREVILITALELFSKQGFETVGVQEIADKAGLAKPSLYYYFKSKRGLLEAIVAERGAELCVVVKRAAEYRRDLVMNLTSLFNETMNFARRDTAFFRLAHSLFSSAPETASYAAGNPLRRELVSMLRDLFIQAATDHGNMKEREWVYAETFFGLLDTWAILLINGEVELDNQLRYRIIHNYLHGIFS
ncbi:MAG: TetR/AcrR family transcriptional regulator [Treponema sp.]|jgi:TetR/AcrR family transcriptional regulator|nr:TetR/AcrR family transcriptional regulator [Treponema sp.]